MRVLVSAFVVLVLLAGAGVLLRQPLLVVAGAFAGQIDVALILAYVIRDRFNLGKQEFFLVFIGLGIAIPGVLQTIVIVLLVSSGLIRKLY